MSSQFEDHRSHCLHCKEVMKSVNLDTDSLGHAQVVDEEQWRIKNLCRIGRRLYRKKGRTG